MTADHEASDPEAAADRQVTSAGAFATLAVELAAAENVEEILARVLEFAVISVDCVGATIDLLPAGRQAARMQASDPRFVSLAAQPGLASVDPGEVTPVLMVDLGIGGSALGRLTLYPAQSEGFAAIDTAVAGVLAVHAALAIAAMRQTAHLSAAMDSRSIVGQAQGIVMERNDVDADAAFALLRRYSQNNNLRLREVAQSLITTRQLAR